MLYDMIIQKYLLRRVSTVAGISAIAAMVFFTASCAKEAEKAPETSTTTTTTTTTTITTTSPSPSVQPTENAPRLEPGAPNPFTPNNTANPAPTQAPGHHSLPGHH
jgi:PBP1b-binding outer membrane lipoprotein LpoB